MESLDVSLRLLRVSTTGQEASCCMSHLSITSFFLAFAVRKLTGRPHCVGSHDTILSFSSALAVSSFSILPICLYRRPLDSNSTRKLKFVLCYVWA
jgi:hypothetical protein